MYSFFNDHGAASIIPYLRLMSAETLVMALYPWHTRNGTLFDSDEDRRKIAIELKRRLEMAE